MILSKDQIKSIILENPNRQIISTGVSYNKTLRRHLYGEDLDTTKIEGYEADDLQKLRSKYARSNKDLFSRLSRPIDKVFSARGGSTYYNLSDTQDKLARNYAQSVRNGYSVKKWIETHWKPRLLDDPYGVIFMEILPEQEAKTALKQGKSATYPTYKSITSIFDYQPNGLSLDYIVFKVTEKEKKAAGITDEKPIFRVVDDAYDYWVRKEDGETITILTDYSIPNYFQEVPAQLNSDIASPEHENNFLTVYDDVLELGRDFFLFNSIKLTYEFMLAFPKYWQYLTACKSCKGTGHVSGEGCKDCNSTGKSFVKNVSDILGLSWPESKEDAIVAPDVAGFVSPPKDYYEISTANLESIERKMNFTLWGADTKMKTKGISVDGQGDTATEAMLDIKPESDRLHPISEMAEKRHKFILDSVIKINLNLPTYQGSSVNYGRRYMIESPDEIWLKYSDARTKGAAASVLDDLLTEYYESKYATDPVKLAIQTKLMKIEPFVHQKASEVELLQNVTAEDKAAKVYFTEWLSMQNEAIILSYSPELLREQLVEFAAEKATAVQEASDKQMEKENAFKKPMAA
jgi:hypothetical protein